MSELTEKVPADLYSREYLSDISDQLKKHWLVLAAVAGPLLAVFVFSMIRRTEWLSMVSAVLAGCFAVFWIDLFCVPRLRYRKLVVSALTGRNHTRTLEFSRMESDPCLVDGVPCRSLFFLGDPDKHGSREQLFYLDLKIPAPELVEGRYYTVKFTGRTIIGLSA